MTIERSGAPAAPVPAGKTATVAGRPHAVGANHPGGSGARSFLSVLSAVESQEPVALQAPPMVDASVLAAGVQPLPMPDPADLLGPALNRMTALPEMDVAGRSDSANQGLAAIAVFGMPLAAAGTAVGGSVGAAREAAAQPLERAAGRAGTPSARPGATGPGAQSARTGLATGGLENAADARATPAPEQPVGLAYRAGAGVAPAPADTGLAALLKSVALRAGSSREAAGVADTPSRVALTLQGADAAASAGPLSEALAALARGPASARSAERPLLRPLQAAAGAPTGSWAEHTVAGANGSVGVTYTIEPATPVPEMAVAEKMNYWISRGVQNAELKLDAFGGGSVDVSISVNGNEAMVEFRTDQPEARRLLQDAMGHLRHMLEGEGLVLSGGFVGTSSRQDPGAQHRGSHAQAVQGAPELVELHATEAASAMSRTPGRAVDLFV